MCKPIHAAPDDSKTLSYNATASGGLQGRATASAGRCAIVLALLTVLIGYAAPGSAQVSPDELRRQAEKTLRGIFRAPNTPPERPQAPDPSHPSEAKPAANTAGTPASVQPVSSVAAAEEEEKAPSGLLMRKKSDWNIVTVLLPKGVDLKTYLPTGTIRRNSLPHSELETYFREADDYSCRYFLKKSNKPNQCAEFRSKDPTEIGWRWFCILSRSDWDKALDQKPSDCPVLIENVDSKSFKVVNRLVGEPAGQLAGQTTPSHNAQVNPSAGSNSLARTDQMVTQSGLVVKLDSGIVHAALPQAINPRGFLPDGQYQMGNLPRRDELLLYLAEIKEAQCHLLHLARGREAPLGACSKSREKMGLQVHVNIFQRDKLPPVTSVPEIEILSYGSPPTFVIRNVRARREAEQQAIAKADQERLEAIERKKASERAEQVAANREREAILAKHRAVEIKDAQAFISNPYVYEGKAVMIAAVFRKMRSATEGEFVIPLNRSGDVSGVVVRDIPRGKFSTCVKGYLVGEVTGQAQMTVYAGAVESVPVLKFRDLVGQSC